MNIKIIDNIHNKQQSSKHPEGRTTWCGRIMNWIEAKLFPVEQTSGSCKLSPCYIAELEKLRVDTLNWYEEALTDFEKELQVYRKQPSVNQSHLLEKFDRLIKDGLKVIASSCDIEQQ